MKTHEVAALLGIATSTVRTWSNGEFKRYLSPTAQGGEGQYRNFTDQDARILAYVNLLKQQSRPRNEIHVSLRRMQTEEWADLPPLPPAPPGVGPIRMVPESTAETALTTQRSSLLREIAIKDERIDQLEAQVADLQQRLEAERLEGQQKLEVERREAQEKREELLRQLIAAETELNLWRRGRIKPNENSQ
jgi:DNA-binding transcriptional MerR regulator